MSRPETMRSALRSATASSHERVDALFSLVDLADRADYGRFLSAQAAAHIPVEDALTSAGADALVPDWADRRRADLIRADLAALGLPMPAAAGSIAFDGPAAALGGIYVLEGSRLGGRMLRRAVPDAFPTRFLDGGDPAAWRRLLGILDERLQCDRERVAAIDAAQAVFALFERGARLLSRAE